MLQLFVIFVCAVSINGAIMWSDCSNSNDTALTVHEFDFHPNPAVFPGELHVSLDLTVNKQIDDLYLDVDLTKITSLGDRVGIPCIGDTNIGTCRDINACTLLEKIQNGSSVISQALGLQIDKILLVALGHQAHCPIMPEEVALKNEHLHLEAIPSGLLSQITTGMYEIVMKIKESNGTAPHVGCLSFTGGIEQKHSTGLLFG